MGVRTGQGPPAVRNRAAELLTGVSSWRKFGTAGSGLRGKELGELPGATTKLLRELARNKGQRSGEGTAAGRSAMSRGKVAAARVWVEASGW
jgi:hypothetical protein